ncbi:MAG: hypothetical protein V3V05_02300 [Pontiella sp.]
MAESKHTNEDTLADSIAMLEQILEVMPQDTDAIRALYNAYCNGGQLEKAFEHLNSLVNIISGGGDPEIFEFVQRQLPRFNEIFPSEVAAQTARIRTMEGSLNIQPTSQTTASSNDSKSNDQSAEIDISEELALAWRLYEEDQLSQEEYSSVLHDLTEISSKELDVPVSVLHVLNDRGFTQMNRILSYLSSRSGVPYVSLKNFELNETVVGAIPLDFSAHDGALPFSFFGNDLLVAVLNPFNNMLVDRIETESGHRCHTYVVEPADYDAALEKLRELAAKAA